MHQPTLFDFEEWRDIPGYEGSYQASSQGRIRSLPRTILRTDGGINRIRGKVLTPIASSDAGHLAVNLSVNTVRRRESVHRLVLEAFVGPCPEGMETRHLNGDAADNRLSNIVYGTRGENNRDRVRHGGHYQANKTQCPLGHPLTYPNLRASDWKIKRRTCLACDRARAHIQRRPGLKSEIQRISDRYYEMLMRETA